jgi:hypothetical protein
MQRRPFTIQTPRPSGEFIPIRSRSRHFRASPFSFPVAVQPIS